MEALAKEFHLPARRISQALAAQGVALRVRQPRRLLPREPLENLYIRQGLSSAEVARQLGVSSQKVRHDLRYHGIALRPRTPALELPAVGARELRRLYAEEGLSLEAIAAELGCSRHALAVAMVRFGIPIRRGTGLRRDEAEEQLLRQLYNGEGLSIAAVARGMGRSTDYVTTRLELYGIARRRTRPRPALDRAWLERAWVERRRSWPRWPPRQAAPRPGSHPSWPGTTCAGPGARPGWPG